MDTRLRQLERDADHDPLARFRLHDLRDRLAWPGAPELTEEVDEEVEGLARRLEDLLARQNGSRLSFRVELGDVAGALGRLEGVPEVEGTRSLWIRGDEVGHLFARSSSAAAHTVVLIVATVQRVSIGATKGLDRPGQHAFFTFVRPDPAGLDGFMGEYVTPASRPALLREWAERAICVRVSREAAARWAHRRASHRG